LIYISIYQIGDDGNASDFFSRVLVYEPDESDYDYAIWRNLYSFYVHILVFATAYLFPEFSSYSDFSRAIIGILDDKNNYITRFADKIYTMKDKPIIIERNEQVYNFDFNSYVIEFSQTYASLQNDNSPRKNEEENKEDEVEVQK